MTPEREAHFRDDSNGSYARRERAEIWAFVDQLRKERDQWRNDHTVLNVDLMAAQTRVAQLQHIDTLQCCCGDCYPIGSAHPDWTEDTSQCGECGKEMELVRPGKHQPLCDC